MGAAAAGGPGGHGGPPLPDHRFGQPRSWSAGLQPAYWGSARGL